MKRAAFVALLGALACGGGGGGGGTTFKNPDTVSFNYGTPTAPASGSAEESAAASASSGMESVLSIGAVSGTDAGNVVGDIANMPVDMAALFDNAISPGNTGNTGNLRASLSHRAAAYLVGDTAAATDGFPAECVTVGTDVITFTNCTATGTDGTLTATETLNGSFHRAAGHVYWDATLSMTVSGQANGESVSYSFGYHMSGDITFGDGAVKGFERADLSVHAKQGSSLDASAAVTYNVDIDIHYLTDPTFCITSGTLTVKLVWTEKPHGTGVPAEEANVPDAAVQFTWTSASPTSCWNAVTVAIGTPQ